MIRALCVAAGFLIALGLTFLLTNDGIAYLTHWLAAIVGAIAGACFVLVAEADSGPCDDCLKLWTE